MRRHMLPPTPFSLGGATQRRSSLRPGAEERAGQAVLFHFRLTNGSPCVSTVRPRRKPRRMCPTPPGCVRAPASCRQVAQQHWGGVCRAPAYIRQTVSGRQAVFRAPAGCLRAPALNRACSTGWASRSSSHEESAGVRWSGAQMCGGPPAGRTCAGPR